MRRLLLLLLIQIAWSRHMPISLPFVPDVVSPPVPHHVLPYKDITDVLEEVDPENSPGLFQGDIAINNELYGYWRVGLKWDIFPEKLWSNGTVPYVISPMYEPIEQITISKAISTINFMTCVKMVPWTGREKDYLLIWPIKYPKGCWSYIGKLGGPQIVSLQPPDTNSPNCLGNEGRSIHELLHALGIFHEQARDDRDKFVTIHKENVLPGYLSNFDKQSLENTTYKFEYDFNSIMHYGQFFFSNGRGKPTITPKYPGSKIGQRITLSKTDCLKVNELYGCLSKSAYLQKKYFTICQVLGL